MEKIMYSLAHKETGELIQYNEQVMMGKIFVIALLWSCQKMVLLIGLLIKYLV